MKPKGDQGEGTCPLCMQEMDLTDQQLKPCKCGYQICVWCWHHLIEMANKDDSEGRCPACRSPYDKERIMAMTISRERLAELKSVKKQKLQKEKSKTSDIGEDYSNVRVVLRNLAYIVGIPDKLADEKTLRKKEFLGQYGKVTRIVIVPGGNQSFPSNSYCSVFATFSKVEEALRCIQVVNGYILAGQPLRACFGATRYCHSWLKNLACRNLNCIYLHAAGSQEDTCTKDEVYAVCTSILQQYPGVALNNFQQRSGSCLPPPADRSTMTSKPLIQLAHNYLDHGKSKNSTGDGGKLGVHPVASSWSSKLTSGKPSYASVAVQKVHSDPPSRPSNSFLSSSAVKVHIPGKLDVQSCEQIARSVNDIQLLDGHAKEFTSSKPYALNGYLKNSSESNFKSGINADIVKEDTLKESSMIHHKDNVAGSNILPTKSSYSNANRQLTSFSPYSDSTWCSTVDTVRQVPFDIPHLGGGSSDGSTDLHLCASECYGTRSINIPNLDARSSSSSLKNNMDLDSYVQSSWEDGFIADEARDNSREERIISDLLSLIDLDDNQADPQSQREIDTKKEDDYLNMFDPLITCKKDDSRYSFAWMSDANHTRGRFPALDANVSSVKMYFKPPGIAKNNAFNENYPKTSDVLRSNHSLSTFNADDGSHLLSMRQSASPVSRHEVYPAQKFHLQSIALSKPPPGFPPRHATDCTLSCIPSSFGSSAQPQIFTNESYVNSCEKIATNKHQSDPHLSYFTTVTEKLPQSSHQFHSSCISSLVTSSDMNRCLEFQNSRNPMDHSMTKNIILREATTSIHGPKEGHLDRSAARDSGIAGVSGDCGLTEITNSGRISFSNSCFGFLIPPRKHDEDKISAV